MNYNGKKNKIALFIDADNAPASKIDEILSTLASKGLVTIRKAYGNWVKPELRSWTDCLHEHAIQPVQQFDITKNKNAADIALVIDCMDILHTKDVDIICLVSSDCDFTPLATRCIADGKIVIGFGERKTPEPFENSCSTFLFLDEITKEDVIKSDTSRKPSIENETTPLSRNRFNGDTRLIKLLRQGISAYEEDDGWSNLANVGLHIANIASFDQRNYGFRKLGDLFGQIDLFECEVRNCGTWVRNKATAKVAKAA